MAFALTYEQWVKQATSNESIPPNSDGLLHVGERAALVEQLSYLKKRNAQLMKQQRAVLLAACEAQAAHAQCADFAGELMRAQMNTEPSERRRTSDEDKDSYDEVVDKLQRLEHENAELLRKTAVLVDYVRATAPLPRAAYGRDDDDDDDDEDDEDDDYDDDKELPPKIGTRQSGSCLPPPVGFDEFANRHWRQCKWEHFVTINSCSVPCQAIASLKLPRRWLASSAHLERRTRARSKTSNKSNEFSFYSPGLIPPRLFYAQANQLSKVLCQLLYARPS